MVTMSILPPAPSPAVRPAPAAGGMGAGVTGRRQPLGATQTRPPGGVRTEHAVIQHEIDPRARCERRQPLQELEWVEQQVGRAIRPSMAQLHEHLPRVGQAGSVVRHRRPQHVATDAFQPRAITTRNHHTSMQVEPVRASVTRAEPGG
jgi:hypothetical protein